VAVEMLAQASYLTTIPQLEHVELSASQISNALRELSQVQYAFFEVGQYWTEFMREAERFERGVRDKAEQLGSYGWTVPLEASLPDTLSILERSINAEAADVTFVDFYAADGNAAYTSLKTELLSRAELEPWREDLTAAYERFAFDDYLSCVNNLLPVFDGFGATKLREPRFHEKKARDRFFARKNWYAEELIAGRSALAFCQSFRGLPVRTGRLCRPQPTRQASEQKRSSSWTRIVSAQPP
jgi:hypothetical protein